MTGLFIIGLLPIIMASCGGGGTLYKGAAGGGGGGAVAENDAQALPGTSSITMSSTHYSLAMELGAGVAVIDTVSESGDYQLKSSVKFTE